MLIGAAVSLTACYAMQETLTEFERRVIAFAMREVTLPDFEAWVYSHADEIAREAGHETQLALLEASFASDAPVVDALNPWFRRRFPKCLAENDLRSLRGSQMSERFKTYVLRTLV